MQLRTTGATSYASWMAIAALVLGVMGALALVLMPVIEWLKRPRLEITPNAWGGSRPEWTFAVVRVRNKPLPGWLLPIIGRESAAGCEVSAEFYLQGQKLPFPRAIDARWSANPEPLLIRSVKDAAAAGGEKLVLEYDPSKVERSKWLDLPPSQAGQEVAVAILRDDGRAFAFSAYSYDADRFGVKDLELSARGVYEVRVKVSSGGLSKRAVYLLNNQSASFELFQLTRV